MLPREAVLPRYQFAVIPAYLVRPLVNRCHCASFNANGPFTEKLVLGLRGRKIIWSCYVFGSAKEDRICGLQKYANRLSVLSYVR